LLYVEKLLKKARKARLVADAKTPKRKLTKTVLAGELFELAAFAQSRGWSAEELLGREIKRREQQLRRRERGK
jgi:hypothetical protein